MSSRFPSWAPSRKAGVSDNAWSRWQANFLAGLAVVLPAVVSIAVVAWLFGTVANITDSLLIFLPKRWTHSAEGAGPMYWYWSAFAFVLAVLLITLIGRYARHYLGQKAIELVDYALLRIPLLNKIYGTIKQVNEAVTSSNKSSFKQVVLVEFPKPGLYSLGFVTGEENLEVQAKTKERTISVFIPTTPNPTSGFLVFAAESQVTKLDMSVTEGIKYIVSLGAIAPSSQPGKPSVRLPTESGKF
jgi:uncharacterized membrane protein